MRNDDTLTMYRWAIAGLLLILAVICVIWLMGPGESFEETQQQFTENMVNYRAEVGKECNFTATSTAADRAECDRVLNELADILRDFRDEVTEMASSTAATTTLPVTTSTTTTTTTTR
jgi:hypothetical protein